MGCRTWLPTPCHSRASGNPGVDRKCRIKKPELRINNEFRMTRKRKQKKNGFPLSREWQKKKNRKNKTNSMLFMCFMVNCCVAVNGYVFFCYLKKTVFFRGLLFLFFSLFCWIFPALICGHPWKLLIQTGPRYFKSSQISDGLDIGYLVFASQPINQSTN